MFHYCECFYNGFRTVWSYQVSQLCKFLLSWKSALRGHYEDIEEEVVLELYDLFYQTW